VSPVVNHLRRFLERLSFTPTERNVVLSLVGAFLLGLGIQFVRTSRTEAPKFDYAAADSEFVHLSSGVVPGGSDSSEWKAAGETGDGEYRPDPAPVNINSAGKAELMRLPGVGETIAERILNYRRDHGPFASARDLLRVKGIGEKKLERLAPFCFVEN